jgi:tetratricopeptide (TPR) repeat protein
MKQRQLFIILILLLCTGCPAPYRHLYKEGVRYCVTDGLFKSRWEDYYERAMSCYSGGFYNEALIDIDKAIVIKKHEKDERMVRTHGMHYIDCFVNRDKGLILYALKQYDKAKNQLELSIQHEPSDKAFHYLDLTRKKLIDKSSKSQPVIHLEIPETNQTVIRTNALPLFVSGYASDQDFIESIIIHKKTVFIECSQKKIEFNVPLHLKEGHHNIRLIARNLHQIPSEKIISVHIDRSGPMVYINKCDNGICGKVIDALPHMNLFLNQRQISIGKSCNETFTILSQHLQKGVNCLIAKDCLGNSTVVDLSTLTHFRKKYLAAVSYVSDANTYSVQPIDITFTHLKPQTLAYIENIPVEGSVCSNYPISHIMLNAFSIQTENAICVAFNHSLSLDYGKNELVVEAKNVLKQKITKTFTITRKDPEPFKLKYRFGIHIVPTYGLYTSFPKSEIPHIWLKFRQLFITALKNGQRFRIIENSEHEIDASLFGQIQETVDGIEVTVRLVANNSFQILKVDKVRGIIKDTFSTYCSNALEKMAVELSDNLHNAFPVADGSIVNTLTDTVEIDFGAVQLMMRWPILAYRFVYPEHPYGSDGFVLGKTSILSTGNDVYGASTNEIGQLFMKDRFIVK